MSGEFRAGTAETPRTYLWDDPAERLHDIPEPDRADLDDIGSFRIYEPGSIEHMYARWRAYLEDVKDGKKDISQPDGTKKPQSWESWRNGYLANIGNHVRGKAYEDAFWQDHGFSEVAGWAQQERIRVNGKNRDYDVANKDQKVAYELKSGKNVEKDQLAIDKQLTEDNWTIIYVFGQPPSKKTIEALEAAGIKYHVWHGDPVRRGGSSEPTGGGP